MLPSLVLAAMLAANVAEAGTSFIGVMIARDSDNRVFVLSVVTDGPADKGGLKTGDLLLKIGDLKPTDLNATVKVIQSLKPGKKVKFVIQREGKEKELEIIPRSSSS